MQYLAVNEQKELTLTASEKPQFNSQQCLVKVSAIGVNRADLLQKAGKYPPPPGESSILGLEVCGQVAQVGQNVSQWQVGDWVYGLVAGGGYAEYVSVNASHLLPLPKGYSSEQGAATAEVFLTAYQSLFTIAGLKADEKVLIHAGASGVGTAAIQLAKSTGAYVAVTVGSDEKAKACTKLGADLVINYQNDNFVEVCKAQKLNFDVVVDVVAGDYINKNIQIMALDGRLVILAILGGRYAREVDVAKMLQKRINIQASTLRNRTDDYKTKLVSDFLADFGCQLREKLISPIICQSFAWQEAEQAHQKMQANENIGKYVLKVSG
jgi:putative PIG3 family NAD(P)H quinone oxidoreductase